MEWNRTETLALAASHCVHCHGAGVRIIRSDKEVPCRCVFRAIFRICYSKFRECVRKSEHISSVSLELVPGGKGSSVWSRKNEEYTADFTLIARRHLSDIEYTIFRYHFLLGADHILCCKKLNMDRGLFFHYIYRIMHGLGRVFREMKPYPLYPLDEYFKGSTKDLVSHTNVVPMRPNRPAWMDRIPMRTTVPVKKSA